LIEIRHARAAASSLSRRAGAFTLAIAVAAILIAAASRLEGQSVPPNSAPSKGAAQVVEIRVGDEIEPVMADYVDSGIAEAARSHASLVLITMDTPGGLSTSMEDIIRHILDSPVPVAVYVSPAGSRGASAGFFILQSADIAAMAPGTHTGAASPLIEIGGFPLQNLPTLLNFIK
jgi:membrane-bound ClpP family serine protease